MSAQIIAVCNQKGGVGKTTVTAGLTEVLAHRLGKRVLLVDVDPQFNATSNMGVTGPEFTLNDVLAGERATRSSPVLWPMQPCRPAQSGRPTPRRARSGQRSTWLPLSAPWRAGSRTR